MPDASRPARLARATALGSLCGLRTFTPPAILALRGRVGRGPARTAVIAAAAGELVADKLPGVPARTAPPALAGRLTAGGLVGLGEAGPPGVLPAAIGAGLMAHAGQRARAALGQRLDAPDRLIAVLEDALAVVLAAALTRRSPAGA